MPGAGVIIKPVVLFVPVLFASVIVTITFLLPVPLVALMLNHDVVEGVSEMVHDPLDWILNESDELMLPFKVIVDLSV